MNDSFCFDCENLDDIYWNNLIRIGLLSQFQMVSGVSSIARFLANAFAKKNTFKVLQYSPVLFVLYRVRCNLCGLAERRLLWMHKVVSSNLTEGKICFSHLLYLEWNIKNCFVNLI